MPLAISAAVLAGDEEKLMCHSLPWLAVQLPQINIFFPPFFTFSRSFLGGLKEAWRCVNGGRRAG